MRRKPLSGNLFKHASTSKTWSGHHVPRSCRQSRKLKIPREIFRRLSRIQATLVKYHPAQAPFPSSWSQILHHKETSSSLRSWIVDTLSKLSSRKLYYLNSTALGEYSRILCHFWTLHKRQRNQIRLILATWCLLKKLISFRGYADPQCCLVELFRPWLTSSGSNVDS